MAKPGAGAAVDDRGGPGQGREFAQRVASCDRSVRRSNRFIASPSCEHPKADPPEGGPPAFRAGVRSLAGASRQNRDLPDSSQHVISWATVHGRRSSRSNSHMLGEWLYRGDGSRST